MQSLSRRLLPGRERAAMALLAGLAVASMVAAVAITTQVLGRLDAYGTAERDNLPWTISQLEVDQMKFRLALERLDPLDPRTTEAARRQFDLLYSRAMTMRTSPTYRGILAAQPAADDMRLLVALLGDMLPLIDSTDAAILNGRDRLSDLATRMTVPIRSLGFESISIDARRADAERAKLTEQIVTLTALSLVMLAALGALMVQLWRLYRGRLVAEAVAAAARERELAGEQARARFLGMISHEMRTPLNGLLGALELLEDSPLNPEQARFLRIMRASGAALRAHIDEALAGLQAETGQIALRPAPFDLDALLTEIIDGQRAAASARGNRLLLEIGEGGLGQVLGDRQRLAQVLLNLLSNAIKFTSGGTVTLSAKRLADGRMAFDVVDTGVGIPEDDLSLVFEDFVRLPQPKGTQPEGTGLGLGIARQLVTQMDGCIEARSTPGAGSVFSVRVALPPVGSERAAPPATRGGAARPLRVLVVEDTPASRLIISAMLLRDGHEAILAHDGLEGVRQADKVPVDLVLMDIDMPRLDGIEATRRIREGKGPNVSTPIIALTAHGSEITRARIRAAGGDGIETKPLSRERLRTLVHQATTTPPLLDTAHLSQLVETLPRAQMMAVLDGLEHEAGVILAALADAHPDRVPDDLGPQVHRLGGTAATCGATALHAHLSLIEAALDAGREDETLALLSTLPALWHATRAALAPYRSTV
ncbi:MAG: response regulator [Roseovarius sp.]|nr:response regulator [Roseovarius sp.]